MFGLKAKILHLLITSSGVIPESKSNVSICWESQSFSAIPDALDELKGLFKTIFSKSSNDLTIVWLVTDVFITPVFGLLVKTSFDFVIFIHIFYFLCCFYNLYLYIKLFILCFMLFLIELKKHVESDKPILYI